MKLKMNFKYFQIQNWMLQAGKTGKVYEKMGSFLQFSFSFPALWSLNCRKKCIFSVLCWPQQKKSKYVKAIYIYASERSCYVFSENVILCYAMT